MSVTKLAWIVTIGMPVTLPLWFTILYFAGVNVNNPSVAVIVVDWNTLLYLLISLFGIKASSGFALFKWENTWETLLVALLVGAAIGLLDLIIPQFSREKGNYPGVHQFMYSSPLSFFL